MKKIKEFIKNNIIVLIVGIIIGTVTIVVADGIVSTVVIYDNSNSHSGYTTAQDALDDLYSKALFHIGYLTIGRFDENLSMNLLSGLYRYRGLVYLENGIDVNNYICFGTKSKTDCTSELGLTTYMYRIIGITEDGQMKLIKRTSLDKHAWGGATLTTSTLYSDLNDSYYLTNTTYFPDDGNDWADRIVPTDWHYGNINPIPSNNTATVWAELELALPTTTDADSKKIGLMYVHDYLYASIEKTGNESSWINMNNNGNPIDSFEWVISHRIGGFYYTVRSGKLISMNIMSSNQLVRPVFFLDSNQTIASGTGTIDDPYILS